MMKRSRGKKFYFRSRRSLRLTREQTRRYEDAGPVGNEFRREAKEIARKRANETGKSVEIYSSDGIVFEQVHPELDR